ncbi:hypothetical protein SCHPADRAFT_898337 [Schizopora paradoxa]|uniref:Uncharacterized protein n=1 Tax=Schizopora paradoxa TaxID=27342 RepID=A0A0H2SRN3_9AGAM|nr:hypothetical protein SCHPADRAFT_898337 [Schizopora paradoxa]
MCIDRRFMVDAFLEETFRFEHTVVETTDDPFDTVSAFFFQTLFKRFTDHSTLILVAKFGFGPDHDHLCRVLRALFGQEKCNATGVIGVTIVQGNVQFHLYDPKVESLTLYGPPEGFPIISFLRNKVGMDEDQIVEKAAKKVADELIAVITRAPEAAESEAGLGSVKKAFRRIET